MGMKREAGPWLARGLACALLAGAGSVAVAAEPPLAAVTPIGPVEMVFSPARDRCDGDDVPDRSARAFRDDQGRVVLFALHTLNRALRGPGFDRLKIDCRSPLESHGNADPSRYDDASWIAATWTRDGRRVEALVHHEFQANTHPSRCGRTDYLACWYNSIVAVRSTDGGHSFVRPDPPVLVAGAPFRQEVEQGRHRGFFNPSNIVQDRGAYYFLSSTTGWAARGQSGSGGGEEQEAGACLFRTRTPDDPATWRAFDGKAFSIAFKDPYRAEARPRPCMTIAPFPAPVGAVVRHRGSGAWIAVFQARADGRRFAEPGLYTTSSRDLLHWDAPHLLVAGPTLYDPPCEAGGRLIAYPSLIDRDAEGRNFDDVGDTADLYYVSLRVEGCTVTSERDLVRRRVAIRVLP